MEGEGVDMKCVCGRGGIKRGDLKYKRIQMTEKDR